MSEKYRLVLGLGSALGLLIAGGAQAIVGDQVTSVRPADYPFVCEIHVTIGENEDACTGTLISPTRVVTAGHCFGRYFSIFSDSVSVSCGGASLRSPTRVTIADPSRDDYWRTDLEPALDQDVAIVDFGHPTGQAPIVAATRPDTYFTSSGMLQNGVTCQILGFGLDNAARVGTLHSAPLNELNLSYYSTPHGGLVGGLIYLWPKLTPYLTTSPDHGDSGGPLICQAQGQPPELVGIIGGYQPGNRDEDRIWAFLNPVWRHVK